MAGTGVRLAVVLAAVVVALAVWQPKPSLFVPATARAVWQARLQAEQEAAIHMAERNAECLRRLQALVQRQLPQLAGGVELPQLPPAATSAGLTSTRLLLPPPPPATTPGDDASANSTQPGLQDAQDHPMVAVAVVDPLRGFPMLVTPAPNVAPEAALEWLLASSHVQLVQGGMEDFGAVLLRGFGVAGPAAFERVVVSVEPEQLEQDYYGTSPRRAVAPEAPHVFSASEFPGPWTVPQHAEMAFLPNPPARIYFHAEEIGPALVEGQTPLTDFSTMLEALPAELRARFCEAGVTNVRRYPSRQTLTLDPLKTKSWQDMFSTTDKAEALRKAAAIGMDASFDRDDLLTLRNTNNCTRVHARTGRPVWHNHCLVLDTGSYAFESGVTVARTESWYFLGVHLVFRAATGLLDLFAGSERVGHAVVRGDGGALRPWMPDLREVAWKHTVIYNHQQGDVACIDNFRVAHGRQAFRRGPRRVHVAWTKHT